MKKTLNRLNARKSKNLYSIISGDETWIYSYEPEGRRQLSLRVFPVEEKPTKVILPRSVSKNISANPLRNHRTATADWYTICVPEGRIILHQDNTSLDTARQTIEFLMQQKLNF